MPSRQARLDYKRHPEALANFMHAQGGFLPEAPEPTIAQGSPPPRRRRSVSSYSMNHSASNHPMEHSREFEDRQTDPMYSPSIPARKALPDALLSKAFGASTLLFQHAETSSEEVCNDLNELESLKKLSMNELLAVFRGTDPAPPHPSPSPSYDASPWEDRPSCWPPLPHGPPPSASLEAPSQGPLYLHGAWGRR